MITSSWNAKLAQRINLFISQSFEINLFKKENQKLHTSYEDVLILDLNDFDFQVKENYIKRNNLYISLMSSIFNVFII